MRGRGGQANGQTIGGGLGHGIGADVATRTGLVLDDHHAQRIAHAFGQRTRGDIERTARCVGHDEADGFLGLGEGGCKGRAGGEQREETVATIHCLSILAKKLFVVPRAKPSMQNSCASS
ncbi:hypothetical protein D3C71_1555810 [compost metagenome]